MQWLAPLVRRYVAQANQPAPAASAAASPAESQALAGQTAAVAAEANTQAAKRKRKPYPNARLGSELDTLAPQGNVLTSSTWVPRRNRPPAALSLGGV
jgi:hypothetical protein